jgi:hypothetical protein
MRRDDTINLGSCQSLVELDFTRLKTIAVYKVGWMLDTRPSLHFGGHSFRAPCVNASILLTEHAITRTH